MIALAVAEQVPADDEAFTFTKSGLAKMTGAGAETINRVLDALMIAGVIVPDGATRWRWLFGEYRQRPDAVELHNGFGEVVMSTEDVAPIDVGKAIAEAWWEHVKATTGHSPVGVNFIALARILARFIGAGWEVGEVKRAVARCHSDARPLTAAVLESYLDGRRDGGFAKSRRTAPGMDRLREMLAEAQQRKDANR